MQFLAPLFLAALGALAAPIIFHLRRERPKDRVAFSAVMFLDPVQPRAARRRRLDDLVLLALRCLGLALLAFAFARPFFTSGQLSELFAGTGSIRFLLIDTSASMRGERFNDALGAAEKIIRQAGPSDVIALAAFDRSLHPVVTIERSRALAAAERVPEAIRALRTLQPGWFATNLGEALTGAADSIAAASGAEGAPARLYVISDLQRGAGVDALEGCSWPRNLQVVPVPIGPGTWTNAGVHMLPDPARDPGSRTRRARVASARDSERADFAIAWSGDSPPSAIRVEPGESAVFADTPDASITQGSVRLTGDDFDFDNEAWFVSDPPREVVVDYWGGADPADPAESLYFLNRAMQPAPGYTVRVRNQTRSPGAEPPAALAIIDGNPAPEHATAIKAFLDGGGAGLMVLRESDPADTLSRLAGADVPIRESAGGDYALLGEIDFDDPIFAPFADPRFRDFSKIHVWKHRAVALDSVPTAAVLARFDNGDPALIRIPAGRGRLFVLATSWTPGDSQLALSSKFAPLLHSILAQSPQLAPRKTSYLTGESVRLPKSGAAIEATEPGILHPDPADPDFAIAVNLHPAESEISPLAEPELRALGIPLDPVEDAAASQARRQAQANEELERRQKVWWWLILSGTAVFLVETLAAARQASRQAPTPDAT